MLPLLNSQYGMDSVLKCLSIKDLFKFSCQETNKFKTALNQQIKENKFSLGKQTLCSDLVIQLEYAPCM